VDTARLLATYADRIFLSPINSGSTIYNPRERGIETFLPFHKYPFDERRKLRGVANAVAETALTYAVPDLQDFAVRVEHRKGGRTVEVLFERP
jgi:Family of unknown function (DUF7002)